MNQNESLIDVVALLYKWKKHIIGAAVIAAIIAAIIALMLPNYYKASTLFYAASLDLSKPDPLGDANSDRNMYGSDTDLDRLFSISNSSAIVEHLRDSFNLYNYYEIDADDPKAMYKLSLKLNKLYETTKTKYDALQLSVEDTDPQFAAQMANAAREKVDEISQEIIKSSQRKMIKTHELKIARKDKTFAQLTDSLYNTRIKYNIFNTASQGEAFGSSLVNLEGSLENATAQIEYLQKTNAPKDSILILKAKKAGYERQFTKLKKNIDSYNNGYPTIISLERERRDFGDQLTLDKERLVQLKAVYNAKTTGIQVVELAQPPVVKSRPKRSILVIGVSILTGILMSLWVIVQDQVSSLYCALL